MTDSARQVLDQFFNSYYRLRPVNATFTGVHAHDHALPDWSPEGLEVAEGEMRARRAALRPAIAAAPRRYPEQVDLELADAFLEIQLAEIEGPHFQRGNPSLHVGEAIFGVLSLVTRDFAPFEARLEKVTSRLLAVPRLLADGRRTLGSRPIPSAWTARALRECQGALVFLRHGLERWLAHGSLTRSGRVLAETSLDAAREAGRQAQDSVGQFVAWLTSGATVSEESGCACGPELFDLLLARGHWCRRSRAELLGEAKDAFEAARAALDERARRHAAGGWADVQAQLASEHPAPERYLASFQETWDACRRVAQEHDLVTWPDYPIRYVPIPEWTRDAAPYLYYLSYRSPAPFDRLDVHDYLVTPLTPGMTAEEQQRVLRANNNSVIKLNHVVHHGAIGHHVQNFYACRSASRIGQIAAVDCASRIAMFSGGTVAEGWACYATDLMDEAGFLTPLEQVSERHSRVRQLARAIVDIELHQGTMSLERASAFYHERAGMAEAAARAEACKNSMFPGAAVMYWLGKDAIHRLRAEQSTRGGASFSLGRFHDRFLAFGAIPALLIAELWDQV
jgi:hypothetical protein